MSKRISALLLCLFLFCLLIVFQLQAAVRTAAPVPAKNRLFFPR